MSSASILSIQFVNPEGLRADVVAAPGVAVVLGRDSICDVRLEGRKISRRHLRIENRSDGVVLLVDFGSHNGTFVNGVRVCDAILRAGDVVQAGEWQGTVTLSGGHAEKAPGMMPAVSLPADDERKRSAGQGTEPRPEPQSTMSRLMAAPRWGAPREPTAPVSIQEPVFHWEEEGAAATDVLHASPMQDNPIVRRLHESQVNLDFRGLSELTSQAPEDSGLRPVPQNVDGIALRLVFKVTEALARSDSMEEFLAEMCDSLQGAARAKAVIVLLPDEHGELVPRAVKLRRAEEKVQLSRTVIEHATKNRAALTTEDAAADARFARGESVLRFDLKAVLCCPLLKDDHVVGALYLTRDLPFSHTERDLVAALAQLIAMGLERSRLREQYANAERIKRSLERFHAPDVVRRLMMESNAPAGARGDGLFLEPLTATVLFCDLAGFTQWCEAHDAETVGRVLNAYLGAMIEAVFAHGGTVDKFIGDAIMCIFGAPFMSDDDALRAVRCAVAMRQSFRTLVASGACGDSARGLEVHIGINTGRVVAGTVGSALRMEYTALGDTVNIAARLEGIARPGQIVVGPATAALVRDHLPLRTLGPVALKGKSESIESFEVPDEG